MTESKIKGANEKVSRRANGDVAAGAKIVSLTIPTDGLYLITYSDSVLNNAWFMGQTSTYHADYRTGPGQAFTRYCTEGEELYEQNLTGAQRTYVAYFEAFRLM